jgi:hypothetical protein
MASEVNFGTPNVLAADSALDIVGFDTTTGITPGALLIAPKWTIPIRPQPITPTRIGSFVAVSVDICRAIDDERDTTTDASLTTLGANANAADDWTAASQRRTVNLAMMNGEDRSSVWFG